jgi:signal transduction histidine kinase
MTTDTAASLVNLLGFITGLVLYAMLLWLVVISRRDLNRLALLTGFLGFAWNAGAFAGYGLLNLGVTYPPTLLLAAAFGALCFLPSVVVHSALAGSETISRRMNRRIAVPAYLMSGTAAAMNFHSALTTGTVPSQIALRGVTVGFGFLMLALLVVTREEENRARILWVAAMSIFAVSALHLSYHQGNDPWWIQLAGHHASLPLVLLLLYQDFRFALADIFLKRALALMLLAGLTFGAFAFVISPLLRSGPMAEQSTALLLAMWVATALAYPFLRRGAGWFVDKVVLKRVDYGVLGTTLLQEISRCESHRTVLDVTTRILGPALSCGSMEWLESTANPDSLEVQADRRAARVAILTAEQPQYLLNIKELAGGRRLLSDDIGMLQHSALIVARRIDAIRSMERQYRHEVEEQEIRKLAAEAELRALRAQVNPHFLFNALTTIGYLIQTAPDRALNTLMRLSGLLRGVLRSSEEFVTIGEEVDLIEAYLDIERARFEDRLSARIDVPKELRHIQIPALVIQPLVENSIKHGISQCVAGGEVRISVRLEGKAVVITVTDTGAGVSNGVLARRRSKGLGLSNVEQRLRRYGASVPLRIESTPGIGTAVEVHVPLRRSDAALVIGAVKNL